MDGEPPGVGIPSPELTFGPAGAARTSAQALGDSHPAPCAAGGSCCGTWVGPLIVSVCPAEALCGEGSQQNVGQHAERRRENHSFSRASHPCDSWFSSHLDLGLQVGLQDCCEGRVVSSRSRRPQRSGLAGGYPLPGKPPWEWIYFDTDLVVQVHS